MSTTERAARVLKLLKDEEWKALAGLEKAARGPGTADVGMISRLSRLPPERVMFAVDQLAKKGLVKKHGLSIVLTKEATEVMALREYVKRDLVYAFGAIIAKGKESDVYEVVNEEGTPYALKFFKLGRTSFTRVRQKRFQEGGEMRSWVTLNYEAARREFTSLRKLEGLGPAFPKALAHNRSTVLLEHVSGVRLSERPHLVDPRAGLKEILASIRKAYTEAGLVNADLSEYNVLTDGANYWLIDWPQAVGRDHPNTAELLRHDVSSIVKFFRRAYDVEVGEEAAFRFASGSAKSLEQL